MKVPAGLSAIERTTWILGASQALYFATVSADLTLMALIGLDLAPNEFMATVPLAIISVSGSVASYLTGRLRARFGYLSAVYFGCMVGLIGSLICVVSVVIGSFLLLCVGSALIGIFRSIGSYIRYLAADLAEEGKRDRAMSLIQYGGLLAAVAGPFLAAGAARLFTDEYVGSFLLVAVLIVGIAGLFRYLRPYARPDILVGDKSGAPSSTQVPVSVARKIPAFSLGLLGLCAAAGFMSMIMSMGPIAGHHSHLGLAGSAVIIQWHLVGMFAPALVSGVLLARIGPIATGALGALVFAVGAVVGTGGHEFWYIFVALALNGVAWNLLYLAGSSLIVRTYDAGRGGRVQAVVEGASTSVGALASLSAGIVYREVGWQSANSVVLFLALVLVAVYTYSFVRSRQSRRTAPVRVISSGSDAREVQ